MGVGHPSRAQGTRLPMVRSSTYGVPRSLGDARRVKERLKVRPDIQAYEILGVGDTKVAVVQRHMSHLVPQAFLHLLSGFLSLRGVRGCRNKSD